MCIAVTKFGIESTKERLGEELNQINCNEIENVPPLVPFIQECSMCHSIWDYYSEMRECPKCGTRFKVES